MKSNTKIKRRRAIRCIAVAGGFATSAHWIKPTVSTVVLPAHAMTTESLMINSGSFGGNGLLYT